jgi:hypothetical protein
MCNTAWLVWRRSIASDTIGFHGITSDCLLIDLAKFEKNTIFCFDLIFFSRGGYIFFHV